MGFTANPAEVTTEPVQPNQQHPTPSFGQSMQQRYPIAGGLAQMVFGGQNNAMPTPELPGQAQMPQNQEQQGQAYIPPALHNNPIFKLITGI